MVEFSLKFKVKATEQEFVANKRPLFMKFFLLAILLFLAILIISQLELNYTVQDLAIWIAAPSAASLLIFILQRRCAKATEIFAILACLVLYLSCFYFRTRLANHKPDILMGYFFGFLERLTVEKLSVFWQKGLFTMIVFIGRMIITDMIPLEYFILNFSFPATIMIMDFINEKRERKIFKAYYDSRQYLSNLKNLLKVHFTDNLLILNSTLSKIVFTNDSFYQSFGPESSFSLDNFLKQLRLIKSDLPRARTRLTGTGVELDIQEEGEIREGGSPGEEEHSITTERRDDAKHYNANMYNLLKILQNVKVSLEESGFCYSFTFSPRNGTVDQKIYKINVIPFEWEGTKSFVFMFTSITHEYTINTLRTAEENKDKFLETVSHELRTPLNAIIGMVHIMERESKQPGLEKYLKTCKNSASLMLSLTNSILDNAQILNNTFRLNIMTHNLVEIMDDIVSLFKFQCEQKKLYLNLNMAPDLPLFITSDKNRLSQVVINLVGNALKFTYEGGITISVSNEDENNGALRISVSDTGVGIKDKDKEKLFKRFGKLEATSDMNTQGVGLGLNIANTLAKLLNDNQDDVGIRVASVQGRGSTFSFTIRQELFVLPNRVHLIQAPKKMKAQVKVDFEDELKEIDGINSLDANYCNVGNQSQFYDPGLDVSAKVMKYHPAAQSSRRTLKSLSQANRLGIIALEENKHNMAQFHSPSSSISYLMGQNSPYNTERKSLISSNINNCVLVVDDNPFNLFMAKEILTAHGLNIETALNGKLALEAIVTRPQSKATFKLILMDCEMPEMDGYEASKALTRKMKKGEIAKIPIVGLTASTIDSVKGKCLESGMSDCLTKPLLEEDAQKLISQHVQKLHRYL